MAVTLPRKTKQQLADLGVVALYLFGSRAQGVTGPLSDYVLASCLMTRGASGTAH